MASKTARQQLSSPTVTDEEVKALIPQGELPGEDLFQEPVQLTPLEEFCLSRYQVKPDQLSDNVKTIITRIETYVSKMNGRVPINSTTEGAENQLWLFNTFLRALGYESNDLFQALDILLFLINLHRGDTFRDEMVYRFIPYIKRPATEINTYSKILEIMLKISNPLQRSEYARSGQVKRVISLIDPSYKQATFALVNYLSQY